MTGNGAAYRATIRARLQGTRVSAPRTCPYRPRTNGKAERFIRTLLGGWAYGAIYRNSDERRNALPGWLDYYTRQRPHRSLGRQSPARASTRSTGHFNVLGSLHLGSGLA